MRIMQPRIGFLLVTAALLAAGVSSMAVAAQNQAPETLCYSTCGGTSAWLTQAWKLVSYGSEQIQIYHVTVSSHVPGLGQAPTGTVTVKSGSTTLCTIVLSAGRGSCLPSPDALPPGFYGIRGYYSGDATFSASVSNIRMLQVSSVGSGD
jgi:hypothetical protein